MTDRLIPLTLDDIIAYHKGYAADLERHLAAGGLSDDLRMKAEEDLLMAHRIVRSLRFLGCAQREALRVGPIAHAARDAFYNLPAPVKPDEGEAFVTIETALEAMEGVIGMMAIPLGPDDCEACKGARGGTKGNENIVDGRKLCDWCSVDATRRARGETEEHKSLHNRTPGCTGVIVSASGGGVSCTECPGWFCY
ncbi:hypothetical protein GURKE_01310 [Brevundimonas phage vB_BpoS-Gurke]|uniref:Uncharacterized protein n=1 Tax=Brevundimonas phage vB_BpoS-Gurke TaxID=2948599 RepID=A0A9E7STB1_9CAUD|nr:hypothetical protein GURKE_01310 [Brevundimonas phage vB_BpoS-Gurke]